MFVVCYLCSGFFYRQKREFLQKKNKKLLFYILYVNKFEVTHVFTFSYLIFFE